MLIWDMFYSFLWLIASALFFSSGSPCPIRGHHPARSEDVRFRITRVYTMTTSGVQGKFQDYSLQGIDNPILSAAMPASRIHRYIAKEIAVPALLGLSVFTLMILMGRIIRLVEMVLNKGVPATEIFLLFAYLLPAFLVITIPLSFLLGVLLGFGRLSSESETVALKASGISLYGMLKPVFLLATLASVLTGALTLYGEPAGNTAFRSKVFDIATSRATVGIAPKIFNDEFDGLVLYTNEFDAQNGLMTGVFISDQRTDSDASTIFAQQGRIFSDAEKYTLTLRLENGNIHRSPKSTRGDSYQTIAFSAYDISLNMGKELEAGQTVKKKDKDLSRSELATAIREAKTEE
ncbi:MAG TPA: LptF/LptG family permease, partial [Desulfobacteraceae bacterium]|nr:LptF/LptG family permease [Desulfobacteraceae bacterium]